MQEDNMQSIPAGQMSYVPIIVLIIAIAAILLILLFMKVYQVKHGSVKKYRHEIRNVKPPGDGITTLHYNEEIKREDLPEKKHRIEDIPLADLGDITKNLHALESKYHLDAITLSTNDGLVIATTCETGQDDAAHYGQVLKPGAGPSVPGIRLFFINHKGSSVVGIIRSNHMISDNLLESIKNDTEKIMSWWI
jgi:uncharacterized protein YoxC